MTIEVSHSNKNPSTDGKNPSHFGKYTIKDKLTLNLPNNVITLYDLGNGKFSYIRNSQDTTTKKIIQAKSEIFQIELMPVLPIHTPSYKTDFFFIRFSEPLFIAKNSTVEISIPFPIEIGLFLLEQNESSGFDFFSCDPSNSRFGLYGTPEDGKLCKYGTSSLDNKQDVLQPFIHAQFKIKITNELDEATSVRKIVFPVTDHDLYYHNSNVVMDDLVATIKNRVGLHVIETVQNQITKPLGWNVASRDTEKSDYKFLSKKPQNRSCKIYQNITNGCFLVA